MICTGQRSDASSVQQRRQSGTIPTARSPLNLYCSTIWENESHGFWSNSSGLVFQQAPQLMQAMRSIITFIWLVPVLVIHIVGWNHKGNEYCCSLVEAQSQTINISDERNFFIFLYAYKTLGRNWYGKRIILSGLLLGLFFNLHYSCSRRDRVPDAGVQPDCTLSHHSPLHPWFPL